MNLRFRYFADVAPIKICRYYECQNGIFVNYRYRILYITNVKMKCERQNNFFAYIAEFFSETHLPGWPKAQTKTNNKHQIYTTIKKLKSEKCALLYINLIKILCVLK